MAEDKLEKIEAEIVEKMRGKIKEIYSKDSEKAIESEIKAKNYLSEDWQVEYAVQRIQEKIEEGRRKDREVRQKNIADGAEYKPRIKSEEEEFAEKVKNLVTPQEDLFQKALHQEADFFKGLKNYGYKSPWMFSFAVCAVFLLLTSAIICLFVLVASTIEAVRESAISKVIIGNIFILFMSLLFGSASFVLMKKFTLVFIKKHKQFKTKAILIMIIPTIIVVFTWCTLFYMFFLDPNFTISI